MLINSHYSWLERHLGEFFEGVGLTKEHALGLIEAHGDKGYSYRQKWLEAGIPFAHGMAIYLLARVPPFNGEVRKTDKGWVDVSDWVIQNYGRFVAHLSWEDLCTESI